MSPRWTKHAQALVAAWTPHQIKVSKGCNWLSWRCLPFLGLQAAPPITAERPPIRPDWSVPPPPERDQRVTFSSGQSSRQRDRLGIRRRPVWTTSSCCARRYLFQEVARWGGSRDPKARSAIERADDTVLSAVSVAHANRPDRHRRTTRSRHPPLGAAKRTGRNVR
jgi:hypothetical protein